MEVMPAQIIINPLLTSLPTFNPSLQLGILASGRGSNFEQIMKDITENKLTANVKCLIVNKKDCGAVYKAKEYSIPLVILDHNDFKSREELDLAIVDNFNRYDIEGIVMVGWMRIVTNVLIDSYKGKIINLHPSILPSFKGNNAVQKAIKNKVRISGCSVHIVEKEIDSGEILIQAAIPIDLSKSETDITNAIQLAEHRIISAGIAIAGKKWRKNHS